MDWFMIEKRKMEKLDLIEKIKDKEREIRHMYRECELSLKEAEVTFQREKVKMKEEFQEQMTRLKHEHLEAMADARVSAEAAQARIEELRARMDDSAYKHLSEILKALTVKLPTVDLKGINVNVDTKE